MDDPIELLDDITLSVISMLQRDTELNKVKWYPGEDKVPIDEENGDLNEICGSVDLDDEVPGGIENSGQEYRNYDIMCRIMIYVPSKLRIAETPTLNAYRQRIKHIFDDVEDGTTDLPEPIQGFTYKNSNKRELSIPVNGMLKKVAPTVIHESILSYSQEKY